MADLEESCRSEVRELHRFFEAWFTGRTPGEGREPARLEEVLASSFEMITPDGRRVGRTLLLEEVGAAGGAREPEAFGIRILDLRTRRLSETLCLATYEEWQRDGEAVEGRLSSALFRHDAGAPEGVVWLHLHEVGLPPDREPAGPRGGGDS